MTRRILVAYATAHGSTRQVAEAVAATLDEHGLAADVRPAADVKDLTGYQGVVLGAALYMGRWHHDARRFLKRHRDALASLPVAVFAMGPTDDEPEHVAAARAELERGLAGAPSVRPITAEVFGGVVDPATLRFPLNRMPAADMRDWEAIRRWAGSVAADMGVEQAPATMSR
jgi:menaquinone-dependent protoporphyrinogen oxidase